MSEVPRSRHWVRNRRSVRRWSRASTATATYSTKKVSTPVTAAWALHHHGQRGRRQALRDEHPPLLQHLGFAIPPQADSGWIGEAGPGPSYLDPESGGLDNDFTDRNTTFLTWNLLHLARMLKDAGGIPAHGT